MRADDLNARARLRAHARQVIRELRQLGVDERRMKGRSLVELDQMLADEWAFLLRAPKRSAG